MYARWKDRLQELSASLWNWLAAVTGATVQRWRTIDPLYRSRSVRGLAAGFMLVGYLAFSNVLVHQGYDTVPFAKPALPSMPWEERVAAFGRRLGAAFELQPEAANEFAGWILEAADRQRLEPELIASLVQAESTFRKQARSHVGAVGPTQVQPRFWNEFCGGDDLTDPGYNIHCGAQVLAHLKQMCGGGECALVAYNVGRNSERKHAARRFVSKIGYHLLQLKTL